MLSSEFPNVLSMEFDYSYVALYRKEKTNKRLLYFCSVSLSVLTIWNDSFFCYQHFLSKPDPHVLTNQQRSQSGGRRFRYRTTVTEGHRQQQQQQHQRGDTDMRGQPAGQRQTHIAAQRDRKAVGRERRRLFLICSSQNYNYDVHIFTAIFIHHFMGFTMNQQIDQLPVGTAVFMSSWVQILFRLEFFLRPCIPYCLKSIHYCKNNFKFST